MKKEPSSTPSDSLWSPWRNLTTLQLFQALLIIGAVLWIYYPSLRGTWIGDDTWYLRDNPLLRNPWRAWNAWFAPGSWVEFYPIQECVQWFQWLLWHENTLGYHLTNVCLHILSTFLLWHLFRKLGLRLAWLGALLFAIHPETVDSVSEIVELKNTLSLPPFIVAMCLYLDFDRTGSRRAYLWSFTFFLVAMLCKITMMGFPAVILLHAWWRRGKIGWTDVRASLPFFVVSLVLLAMTMLASQVYAHPLKGWDPVDDPLGGFWFRLALAGQVTAFYFSRVFLPLHPMPIYPQWSVESARGLGLLAWVILMVVFAFLWAKRGSWGRHALFGIGFFLINLSPFLGFKGASYMNYTWVLDHMLYLPMIGLIALVTAALGRIFALWPAGARPVGVVVLVAISILLAMQSHLYAAKFINEETLDRYNLRFTQDMEIHTNLGAALLQRDAFVEAEKEFRLAIACNPAGAKPQFNLGGVLLKLGRVDDSVAAYYQACADAPDVPQVHGALADTLFVARRFPEAAQQYRETIRLNYAPSRMYGRLGECLFILGKTEEGMADFQTAAAIDPHSPLAQYNLAKGLCNTGHVDDGAAHYREAIRLEPGYAEAHNNLGIVLFRQGHPAEARTEFSRAIEANPNYRDARNNLQLAGRDPGSGK